jgi:hypothetical protein
MLYRQFVAKAVEQGTRKDLTSSSNRQRDDTDQYDERILGDDDFIKDIRTRKEFSASETTSPTILEVVSRVCRYYSVDPKLLHQRTRTTKVSTAKILIKDRTA